LVHTADWEMWVRALSSHRGVMVPLALASYRVFSGNDTGRLMRSADNLRDYLRLYANFSAKYPGFDERQAVNFVRLLALQQAKRFAEKGDKEATTANLRFWAEITPFHRRLRSYAGRIVRRVQSMPPRVLRQGSEG